MIGRLVLLLLMSIGACAQVDPPTTVTTAAIDPCAACSTNEFCVEGACVCDPSLAQSADACGCPAVDCNTLLDKEMCADDGTGNFTCQCDIDFHRESDGACGCPTPMACDNGSVCKDGACQCDPAQNRDNSLDCNCEGECAPGRLCQAGRCACAQGTFECGGACVPAGSRCCGDGVACSADEACETTPSGHLCRPAEVSPCYDGDGFYLGACLAGSQCIDTTKGMACVRPDAVKCYEDGKLAYTCESHEKCGPAGCIDRESTVCSDGITICGTDDVCEHLATGDTCRPVQSTPCYRDGIYQGACEQNEVCEEGVNGKLCREQGATPCYNQSGFFTRTCSPGYVCSETGISCLPPGTSFCLDGSVCNPGAICERMANGYTCRPQNTVPCYATNGYFEYWCELSWYCDGDGDGCRH